MLMTPISRIESIQIGTVEFVAPDEIRIALINDAPSDVALNSGIPRPFPRINSYVLIPGEGGFLVAQIDWITIEKTKLPKETHINDSSLINLPYPERRMSVIPVGVLHQSIVSSSKELKFDFTRGIEVFPTVGDPVLLPLQEQLKSIVESGGNERRVDIGFSPLADNAVVSVNPDRLFGRHLAVLGNTGSGKSCSVAGLIRWSIESAKNKTGSNSFPNSRFIIFDPNGEYSKSFSDLNNVHVFAAKANPAQSVEQLVVPVWLWNTSEWVSFAQAGGKAQKPTLVQSLRTVRSGRIDSEFHPDLEMRHYLRTLLSIIEIEKKNGSPWASFPKNKNFFLKISHWKSSLSVSSDYSEEENDSLVRLNELLDSYIDDRSGTYPDYDFEKGEIDQLISLLKDSYLAFGGSVKDLQPIDADIPKQFSASDFLLSLEANAEMMNTSEYVETMILRVKSLLSDARLKPIICPEEEISFESWLNKYICPSDETEGSIVIIDLSLLPSDIVHIITSVIARLTLEALQRYRRKTEGDVLPLVLVMEEAHSFIKGYDSDIDESPTSICTQVFEKIAREGRKFGLGLVLSSQRPSELSPTVLSQCNSFLLHRISNDRDQALVSKLVSDNLKGILRDLPSLPSRNAILLGWASELPILVRMNYLDEKYRPRSNDPQYWGTWIDSDKTVDWKAISEEWLELEY